MTDLTLSDIDALLTSLEPAQVEGFVPVRVLKQLSETIRERDALIALLINLKWHAEQGSPRCLFIGATIGDALREMGRGE